jgi:hypothetical protein
MEQMDAVFWLSLVDTFRARKLDLDLQSGNSVVRNACATLCNIYNAKQFMGCGGTIPNGILVSLLFRRSV